MLRKKNSEKSRLEYCRFVDEDARVFFFFPSGFFFFFDSTSIRFKNRWGDRRINELERGVKKITRVLLSEYIYTYVFFAFEYRKRNSLFMYSYSFKVAGYKIKAKDRKKSVDARRFGFSFQASSDVISVNKFRYHIK